jgi:hypothetical protein
LIMNDELGRMCKELVVVSQDNIPAFTWRHWENPRITAGKTACLAAESDLED